LTRSVKLPHPYIGRSSAGMKTKRVVCQKSADPKRPQFPNTGGWHWPAPSPRRAARFGGIPEGHLGRM